LWHDVCKAFWFEDTGGATHFGIALGTLVLMLNTTLLTLYTFSCHSLRHLIGGRIDCLSQQPLSKACYDCVSGLNKRHMNFAWFSLFGVMFADLYVRLLASGAIHDLRFF